MALSFKQFPVNVLIVLDPSPYTWRPWVGKHKRGHLAQKVITDHILIHWYGRLGESMEASRDSSVPEHSVIFYLTPRVSGPNLCRYKSPREATVTYLLRPGSGTARSWGCIPGSHRHTHIGRTLPRFHRRLHHTPHWAARIRSHLEKGAQIKSEVCLTPDSSVLPAVPGLVVAYGHKWSPGSNQTLLLFWGRGSWRLGCTVWTCVKGPWKHKASKFQFLFKGIKHHTYTLTI